MESDLAAAIARWRAPAVERRDETTLAALIAKFNTSKIVDEEPNVYVNAARMTAAKLIQYINNYLKQALEALNAGADIDGSGKSRHGLFKP